MKKLIALLLACLMILSMAACSKTPSDPPAADNADQNAAPAADAAADNSDAVPEDNSNGLITIDEDPVPEAEPDTAEDSDEYAVEEDGGHTGYSSVDEINELTGGRIARPSNVELPFEEFEIVKVGDTDVAQYVFEAGGVPCGIRFCADFNLCISEMEAEDGSMLFDGSHEEEVITYNGSTAAHWETVDGQYVLVIASEDEEFFNSVYEDVRASSVPGDV